MLDDAYDNQEHGIEMHLQLQGDNLNYAAAPSSLIFELLSNALRPSSVAKSQAMRSRARVSNSASARGQMLDRTVHFLAIP